MPTGEIQPNVDEEAQYPTQNNNINKLTNFVDLCVVTNEQFFDKLKLEDRNEIEESRKIKRVPEVLQRNGDCKEYYSPMEMSFGLVHSTDPKLFQAELKLKLATRFIHDSRHSADTLFHDIKNIIEDLKKKFDEEVIRGYTDDMLARLFLVDGCAILQFIHGYANQILNEFDINNGQAQLIRQDLFLLENQIPFQVLHLLMDKDPPSWLQSTRAYNDILKANLVDFVLDNNITELQSFRNVQELKAAGITVKPSESCSLNDIYFRALWFLRGRVELPPLLVDDSTARKMLNMVAYEMSMPDYRSDCYVTSYINLLDLLIDDGDDVKLLRSADILRNRLSSDVEVASLFNRIGSACLTPPKDAYLEVKSDIQNHCKKKLAVWRAQVYYSHFSNPWTILALLAAITILVLTAIQTWYTMHPKN